MSNNIRKIIEDKGLKIAFVIDKTNISKSHFYDIMNGDANPSITNAIRISKVLGVTVEDLFKMNELEE